MLSKLRTRMAREESGFTLIELLVVMLILGILAAIAIPAFLNQREKGQDADAKADVRTVETAMETYATDNDGNYTTVEADLTAIEGAVNDITADLTLPAPGAGEDYVIQVASDSGRTFTLTRTTSGDKNRTCAPAGGGCVGGSW
jgi:type IV pilus assembly protein PilA